MAATASPHAAYVVARGGDYLPERSRPRTTEDPSHEIKVGQLIFDRVERRGRNADQHLVGRRLRDGNTHRFERSQARSRV